MSSRMIEEKALVHLIFGLKDKLKYKEIHRIGWVNTRSMLADGLTKAGVDMSTAMQIISSGRFPDVMNY